MKCKNKYAHASRLSESEIRKLVQLFTYGTCSLHIAKEMGINRNSANRYIQAIRETLARESPSTRQLDPINFDLYCLDLRQEGQEERLATLSPCVKEPTGALQHLDTSYALSACPVTQSVYVQPLPLAEFSSVWRDVVHRTSPTAPERWRCYRDGSYQRFFRAFSSPPVSGIYKEDILEEFQTLARSRLISMRGVSPRQFFLYIKECEFRFNHRKIDIYRKILYLLRKYPLEKGKIDL